MQYDQAHKFIIQKLEKQLPGNLTYHDVEHTINVIQAAEHLATTENIWGQDRDMLLTAALFHDAGMITAYKNHEEISCDMAREFLPQFDYNKEEIENICALIMATKLPQKPSGKLAEILCDSDLYYLGTDEYLETADKLFRELKAIGIIKNEEEWKKQQISFLESQSYFTKAASDQLGLKKEENLALIKSEKGTHKNKKTFLQYTFLGDVILMTLGGIVAGFALKGFLVPNKFLDGGVTGISLLLHEIYHVDLSYLIFLINLPFIVACWYTVNYQFALKTLFSIIVLGLCISYVPYPFITSDKLLVSVFGGFFLGVGVGLTMRAGGVLDGSEVLALYTLKKTAFTITEIIMALNAVIFGAAALKFGIEIALYSMLVYFTASKTIDYIVEGIEAYTGVTIISGKSEIIKDRLVNEMGRAITIYKGERGYLPGKFEISDDVDIIFTVLTRLELRRLKTVVNKIDPKAFVFANTIKEASGGIIKRRHGGH